MTTPPYPGVDTFDQPNVDAWWTPGWTAQNDAYKVAPTNPSIVPGGPTYTPVNITHAYFDEDGSPLSGFLTFMPRTGANLTQSGTSYRLPARLSGTTTYGPYTTGWGWHQDSSGSIYLYRGQLYVSLMPTDLTGLVTDDNQPLTYLVTEHFDGGRQFQISVPGASSNPVDLDSLMVAGTLQPYFYDPTNVLQNELSATIDYAQPVLDLDIDGGSP